jgi:UDP-N-acetyl-D-mannosaminuronic acid dehydrogenase
MFKYDVCVIGGCGRVGLPLSIAFADKGLKVMIYDLDESRLEKVDNCQMPFGEEGCDDKLKALMNKNLMIAAGPEIIGQCQFVVVTIGTPVEEHLNPRYADMIKFFDGIMKYLVAGQYVILRSTVYPGMSAKINSHLKSKGLNVYISFCPERIAENRALEELASLPQIVSAFDEKCLKAVSGLFRKLTKDIVVLEPIEAELAKLYTNSWRYIQFATANQFFMLADKYGLDYFRIHHAMTYKYPRMQGLPRPGFAAGPCLFKDTMQLAAFSNNSFHLGHTAMLINEGLPNYVVENLKNKVGLADKSVGILGMAFKANSDDERDSLSFKLKKILEIEAGKLYCSDPFVKRDYFVSPEKLVELSDVIIVATPHDVYKSLNIPADKTLVDIWNFYNKQGGMF